MATDAAFKLTYSTMFDPPEQLHTQFDVALETTRAKLGRLHPMWIGGKARLAASEFEVRSPIDHDLLVARIPSAGREDVNDAITAAHHEFARWSATPWRERLQLLRRAAELIEIRVYEISAAVALEVGKNRMEALGEVQETAEVKRPSAIRVLEIASVVAEYPPGFAGIVQSIVVSGFKSG